MVVIIEGLDGVGKTTICQAICDQEPMFTYVKESYTSDNKEKENRIQLMLQRVLDSKAYLYDRTTLIDDFVYGFLNETESSLSQYIDVIVSILSHCQIYHLRLDEKVRRQRFSERGDQYITEEMIDGIAEGYSQFYQLFDHVQMFDLTGDIDQDVKKLIRRISDGRNITHRI